MIRTTNTIVTASVSNPDKDAITKKNIIDISVSEQDVLLSDLPVQVNYTDGTIYVHETISGSSEVAELYFTPLYKEKLKYSEWVKAIDKTFVELEAI